MSVPVDIPTRPDLNGVVPIDQSGSGSSQQRPQGAASGQPSDVAGVLRRNQACLACRRRKLKCDAVRPHCSTCIRSYKHLLRTAPSTNPVLTCEYDDEKENHPDGETGHAEDDEEARRKRRKTSGSRKKRDEEAEMERERLNKRIADLEAQLANKDTNTPRPSDRGPWGNAAMPHQVDSPTAFLEMLSSAASSAPTAPRSDPSMNDGVPNGMQNNFGSPYVQPTWVSTDRSFPETTGPMSYLQFSDADLFGDMHHASPGGQTSMLSPGNVFNFSPPVPWPPPEQGGAQSAAHDHRQNPTASANATGQDAAGSSTATRPSASPAQHSNGKVQELPTPDSAQGQGLDKQVLMDLLYPGWPKTLPEPVVVNALVEAFFDVVPSLPRMLHKGRFMTRMSLPPTHSNFPHPSLLHSICAITSSWCDPKVYDPAGGGDSPCPEPSLPDFFARSGHPAPAAPEILPFSLRHAAFAKDAIHDGLNTGNRLFDVVRAMIILSRVFIDDTRMLETWTYIGLVCRMILPLGLNVRSAELSLKSVMLPPAHDALEREERRVVVWLAMYHDTIASAASGWGTSLALDELTVPLPAGAKEFDRGEPTMEGNPQDLESLDLYIKHPVEDSLVMALKGGVLLNRVCKFSRRWKNRRLRDHDDLDGMQRPEFRELANAIACLQMSFPPSLQNACIVVNKRLNVDLISAHVIPHTAIIYLYEAFADVTDPNDQPGRRLLNAARSIIGIIQQLVGAVGQGAVNLSAVMHSSTSVALVTAARTLLLFYRHALNVNDLVAADGFRQDIETARFALAQYGLKFKIGYHHAQLIEYFLDRATNPTYEKLAAHYPQHPRAGAIELAPQAHLGLCILNALNIKRGYWKLPQTGVTPAMTGGAVSASGTVPGTAGPGPMGPATAGQTSVNGSANGRGGGFFTDSPQPQHAQFGTMPAPSHPNGQYRTYTFYDEGGATIMPLESLSGNPLPPFEKRDSATSAASGASQGEMGDMQAWA